MLESRAMGVPFIDLKRFEDGFVDRWAERCRALSENTQFVGGPPVADLESRLATTLGVGHVIGCANGTDAIQLALRALEVGPGDTVVIPDATFWATFEAVVNVGARVVTVDIDPADLQMDADLLSRAIEEHAPKAAILVHLYGWGSARIESIRDLCETRGVHLVEDGAQSLGATFDGQSLYQGAEIATISFYPAKVLGACGDAGAVTTNDAALADTVRRLGNHGRTSHYEHGLVGWNSRMGGFDAAFLDLSLDYLERRLGDRRRQAEVYREKLRGLDLEVASVPEGYVENGYLNVCLVDPARRPTIEAQLRDRGIGFGNVYPGAMSDQPAASDHLVAKLGGEHARTLSASVLNLPLFAGMTDAEQEEVIGVMRDALS